MENKGQGFKPFGGTVAEFTNALYQHNDTCETCCPGGLPNPNTGTLCQAGRAIRRGLADARGRAALRTGAKL
ncbi:hypothetical protein GCM10027262_78550 [Nocardia tengchongensis]